jgi:hypothetical protein
MYAEKITLLTVPEQTGPQPNPQSKATLKYKPIRPDHFVSSFFALSVRAISAIRLEEPATPSCLPLTDHRGA